MGIVVIDWIVNTYNWIMEGIKDYTNDYTVGGKLAKGFCFLMIWLGILGILLAYLSMWYMDWTFAWKPTAWIIGIAAFIQLIFWIGDKV